MKTTFKIIWLNNIIFLVVFLYLAFCNKPAADDYWFIAQMRHFNSVEFTDYMYHNASGRWSAYFIAASFYSLNHWYSFALALPALFNLFFGIAVVYLFVRKFFILKKLYFSQWQILGHSIFLVLCLFLCSFGIGESWFWTVSITVYFFSVWCFLIILYLIFWGKNKFIHFLFLILASAYIGGASEGYGIWFIMVLLLVFLSKWIDKFFKLNLLSVSITKNQRIKIIIALIIIAAGLLVNYFSPSREIRQSWLPKPAIIKGFWMTAYSLVKIIIPQLLLKIPILLGLWLFCISWLKTNFATDGNNKNNMVKKFLFLSALVIFLILSLIFPVVYLLSDAIPLRATSIISVIVLIFTGTIAMLLFRILNNKINFIKLSWLGLLLIAVYFFVLLSIKLPQSINYCQAWNYRHNNISQQLKEKNIPDTLIIKYLSNSGFLYSVEDTLKPQYLQWQQLEIFYNYKGKFIYQK